METCPTWSYGAFCFLSKSCWVCRSQAEIHLETPGDKLKKSLTRQCQPFRGSEEMVEPSDPIVSQAGPTARDTDIFLKDIGAGREWAWLPLSSKNDSIFQEFPCVLEPSKKAAVARAPAEFSWVAEWRKHCDVSMPEPCVHLFLYLMSSLPLSLVAEGFFLVCFFFFISSYLAVLVLPWKMRKPSWEASGTCSHTAFEGTKCQDPRSCSPSAAWFGLTLSHCP